MRLWLRRMWVGVEVGRPFLGKYIVNPLVYFKEFSANITYPSYPVDSTSSDLSLLSHPIYPASCPLSCPWTHPRSFISKYSFQGRLGPRGRNKNISMYYRVSGNDSKGLPQAVASVETHRQDTRFSWWRWEGHRPSTWPLLQAVAPTPSRGGRGVAWKPPE